MSTDEEIERLRAEGTPVEARVWVTHFFSHSGSSEPMRAAFRDALRSGGFGTPGAFTEIGSDEVAEGDGLWHHWSFTVIDASPGELRRADRLAREIAETHGAVYDEWSVQRDENGHLRLA